MRFCAAPLFTAAENAAGAVVDVVTVRAPAEPRTIDHCVRGIAGLGLVTRPSPWNVIEYVPPFLVASKIRGGSLVQD